MKQAITSIDTAADRIFNFTCETLTVDQTDEFKDLIEICEDAKILPFDPSRHSVEEMEEFAAAMRSYFEFIHSQLRDDEKVGINVVVQLKAIFEFWFLRDSLKGFAEAHEQLFKNIEDLLSAKYESHIELQKKHAAEIKEQKVRESAVIYKKIKKKKLEEKRKSKKLKMDLCA